MPVTDQRTIPLLEEQISISKTEAITDSLRVATHIEERPVLIEDVVQVGHLQVERVAVERAVAEAPEPRQEGDTLIVSVIEERLFIEKRLFVIEEVRITRTSTGQRISLPETIRSMRATVERADTSIAPGREIDG